MDFADDGVRAPLFLAIWVVMMVAMMFPTASPMIAGLSPGPVGQARARRGVRLDLGLRRRLHAVWALAGVAAYAGALAERPSPPAPLTADGAARIGGVLLIAGRASIS